MNKIINLTPGQRGLTLDGERAFKCAYNASGIFESEFKPIVRFPREAAETIRQVSELRRKNWRSTDRWNEMADYVGQLGELAVMRYLDIPAETAMADFLAGLYGDRGFDLEWNSARIDVKSTRGQALKFKFNKNNRNRDKATAYSFVAIQETGAEVWATLLGFSDRTAIRPFIRDDGRSLFVRAETLRREGVLKPVTLLKTAVMTHSTNQS